MTTGVHEIVGKTATKAISAGTTIELTSITIPNKGSRWLVLTVVNMDFSATGTMNNEMYINGGRRVTRTTQTNGGGCINYAIVNPGDTISLQAYITQASGNATGLIQAFCIY